MSERMTAIQLHELLENYSDHAAPMPLDFTQLLEMMLLDAHRTNQQLYSLIKGLRERLANEEDIEDD